jgi:hypothetical protein
VGNKTPDTVHDANVAGLGRVVDAAAAKARKAELARKANTDNKPTPEQVATIARAAVTPEQVDAVTTIYEMARLGWSSEQDEQFWALLK